MPTLREMWEEAIRTKEKADMLTSLFNAALHEKRSELVVPPGFEIDYLGDGTVKPIAECKRRP